jgi:methionyl-tRNA synthetase
LVNRVVVLSLKLKDESWKLEKIDKNSSDFVGNDYNRSDKIKVYFNNYDLKSVLDDSFKFLDKLNDFTTQKEPWQMIKDETKLEETKEVLYTIAEWLRQVWLALYPFFSEKMSEMFNKLWLENYTERLESWELEKLISETPTFEIKEKWENLFNRFEV